MVCDYLRKIMSDNDEGASRVSPPVGVRVQEGRKTGQEEALGRGGVQEGREGSGNGEVEARKRGREHQLGGGGGGKHPSEEEEEEIER